MGDVIALKGPLAAGIHARRRCHRALGLDVRSGYIVFTGDGCQVELLAPSGGPAIPGCELLRLCFERDHDGSYLVTFCQCGCGGVASIDTREELLEIVRKYCLHIRAQKADDPPAPVLDFPPAS